MNSRCCHTARAEQRPSVAIANSEGAFLDNVEFSGLPGALLKLNRAIARRYETIRDKSVLGEQETK